MPAPRTPTSQRFAKPGFAYMSNTAHPDLLPLKLRCAITKLYRRLPTELRIIILEHIAVRGYPPYRHWDALQYADPVRAEDIVNLVVGRHNIVNLTIDDVVLADMGVIVEGYMRLLEARVAELEDISPDAGKEIRGDELFSWPLGRWRRPDPVGEARHLKLEICVMRDWLNGGADKEVAKETEEGVPLLLEQAAADSKSNS